jgi:hypothetical protein
MLKLYLSLFRIKVWFIRKIVNWLAVHLSHWPGGTLINFGILLKKPNLFNLICYATFCAILRLLD